MGNKKGKGYLFKRNGIYYVRVKNCGKDIVKSLKTGDEKIASQRKKDFVQSIVRYDKIATLNHLKAQIETEETKCERTERIQIKDMFLKYIGSPFVDKISDDTVSNYSSMANHFLRWFKRSVYMCDVNVGDAVKFASDMKTEMTSERLFATVCVLKRIWRVCMKYDNNIKFNVWEQLGIKWKKDKSRKRRELTDYEIQKLLIAADDAQFQKYWNGEVRMLFEIGAFTSLRLMDCVSLRWNEVGYDLIKKLPKKTHKEGIEAIIPICNHLRNTLDEWKKSGKSSEDNVLPILSNLCRRKINKLVHRVFKLAGIAIVELDEHGRKRIKTGFHSLRIHALSTFLRICGDINVVKTIAAHKNADMTLWYTHCNDRDVRNAFQPKTNNQSILSTETQQMILSLKDDMETVDDFIQRVISQSGEALIESSKVKQVMYSV